MAGGFALLLSTLNPITLLEGPGMATSEKTVECGSHGTVSAAYICIHLADNPLQKWFCDYPEDDNPWPDAWCGECEKAFQREGEWSDNNPVDIRLTCHCCYEANHGRSVQPLMEARRRAWQPLVSKAVRELSDRQARLEEKFEISRHERWDWDQETCRIVFSNSGVPAVTARIQFVGSISTTSDTWLWSWANPSFEPHTSEDLQKVRDYGEGKDFASLTVPKWPGEEVDGWEMTAVAAHLLDAEGAYRTPSETGFTFMLLMDMTAQ